MITTFDLIVIVIGVWGCIYIVGETITEIAEIKMNANPINKILKINANKEKEGK